TVRCDNNFSCSALTLNGTGVLDFNNNNVTLNVGGTMTMNGTSQITGNNANRVLALAGDFIIPAGQTGSIGGVSVTQTSSKNFTINGTFIPSNATGNKNLGNLIINAGGSWSATSTETYNVQNATLVDGSIIDGSSSATINILGNLLVQA